MIPETLEDLYGRRYGGSTITRVRSRQRTLFGVNIRTLHATATMPEGSEWLVVRAVPHPGVEPFVLGLIHNDFVAACGPLDPASCQTVRAPGALA